MADTGWVSAGLVQSIDRDGQHATWLPFASDLTTDLNAIDDDWVQNIWNDAADPPAIYTDWLRLTQFGFSIPAGNGIDGIEVRICGYANPDGVGVDQVLDSSARLRVTAGQVGDDKASAVIYPNSDPSSFTTRWGGSADDWNAGLTRSDVNSNDFGFDLSLDNDVYPDAGFVNFDCIQMRVTYSPTGWLHTINGVSGASIGNVNGVDRANIASINGVA